MTSVVDEVWSIANGSLKQFYGDLDDYKKFVLADTSFAASNNMQTKKSGENASVEKSVKVKIDVKLIKRLEARIAKAESSLQELELRLADPDLYLDENKLELHDVVVQHQQVKEKLQLLEQQWLTAQEG